MLMTVPGYPVLGTHAKYLGGVVYNMKLEENNDFFPTSKLSPRCLVRPRSWYLIIQTIRQELQLHSNFLVKLWNSPKKII